MIEKLFITAILIQLSIYSYSNPPSDVNLQFKKEIYTAYINGKIEAWPGIMNRMEESYLKSKNVWTLFTLVQAQYGYIGYSLGLENRPEAKKHLDKFEKNIESLLKLYPEWSEVLAMKGAMYGFMIALEPVKAVYLGNKSLNNINKAVELDTDDPTGYVELGNAWYYMPVVFGGSPAKALLHYENAVKYFERENKLENNWLYLSTLTSLAKCYEETDQFEKAEELFEKIIEFEPGFLWVSEELKPAFDRRNS